MISKESVLSVLLHRVNCVIQIKRYHSNDKEEKSISTELFRIICLILLLLVSDYCSSADYILRVVASESWSRPMLENSDAFGAQNPTNPKGLIPSIYKIIANQMDMELKFVWLPRMRLDKEIARYDLWCVTSPDWISNSDNFIWSEKLFSVKKVIVGRIASKVGDLTGTIATVRGFQYPALTAQFSQGRLRREDTSNQTKALTMFFLGRVDYAITDEFHYLTIRKQQESEFSEESLGFVIDFVSENTLHCAVVKSNPKARQVALAITESLERIHQLSNRYLTLQDK